ncbi:hypothetical protein DBV05_g8948 [Lasiodiplodia theobromae]|uniref:Acyltransferase 3 domain-containing protein n=1 Tax=Lasiodiplodia theobromae TaxID=45133 RepID=A0A5N5D3W6_9PEZI|nr:hypothetical protein DBV05_g8948 [Lasiodiplodia theobromae]
MASVIVALNHYLYGEFSAPWLGFGSSPENRYLHQLPFVRIIWCGHAMPPIFFVVSGYCACYSALRLRDAQDYAAMAKSLSRSAFRRGLRLYLPVFFMSALSQLLLFCGLYNWRWTETALVPWHAPIEHLKYLATYLLDITNLVYLTDNPGLNVQFWVIPLEYIGSLTIYVTVLALAGVKAHFRPAVLAALIAPFVYRGHYNTYTFLAGHLICEMNLLHSQRGGWRFGRRVNAALFFFAWFLIGLPDNYFDTPGYSFLSALEPSPWGAYAQQNWRGLAAILLVFSMSNDIRLQSLPNSQIPQYLSTISWEIYLSHTMIYRLWRNPLVNFFMSWFEYATFAGTWFSFVASGVVMATIVQWGAERLKMINNKLSELSKKAEGNLLM